MKSINRLFVSVIMLMAACSPSPRVDSLGITFQRGDEIVAALEQYRAENKVYPERLDDLVPKYVPELRTPDYGEKKWDYVYYRDRNDFGLFVWGAKRYLDGYWYNSSKKKWEVVKNSF